jgi:hypothetical protein
MGASRLGYVSDASTRTLAIAFQPSLFCQGGGAEGALFVI